MERSQSKAVPQRQACIAIIDGKYKVKKAESNNKNLWHDNWQDVVIKFTAFCVRMLVVVYEKVQSAKSQEWGVFTQGKETIKMVKSPLPHFS